MKVDLVKLLSEREICQPSRIARWESQMRSNLMLEVAGYPWWLEDPGAENEANITFQFEGISDALIFGEMFTHDSGNEDLLFFNVTPLGNYTWHRGVHCDVYCSSPLPKPLEIYSELHDFLISTGCPYGPETYLNMGDTGTLQQFLNITASNSYLICEGPDTVCDAVCEILKKHGVNFNTLRGKTITSDGVFVQLGPSHLVCQTAYAIFD